MSCSWLSRRRTSDLLWSQADCLVLQLCTTLCDEFTVNPYSADTLNAYLITCLLIYFIVHCLAESSIWIFLFYTWFSSLIFWFAFSYTFWTSNAFVKGLINPFTLGALMLNCDLMYCDPMQCIVALYCDPMHSGPKHVACSVIVNWFSVNHFIWRLLVQLILDRNKDDNSRHNNNNSNNNYNNIIISCDAVDSSRTSRLDETSTHHWLFRKLLCQCYYNLIINNAISIIIISISLVPVRVNTHSQHPVSATCPIVVTLTATMCGALQCDEN